ncbi:30S ribosomal protein S7 [Candidatus Daviesbacteria bacterium RIFCSPHIGHO2_02_FULL_39_12]|uniref:Small ribosomal subunit protein uS7 n=2 Tax=Candidatus Daviesiibacteriota TaxID=1752718 RepID=A0A1F5J9M4_9BACT|nr:MAG: 30S ribosomal protein S7 [Candidatus Daviesbacteria bacterium RIFCSPHIGHO2_02_FULL_39_12]OGE72584.1 MAG: 30S ribosomal protein S7 [Candidatus Daviesbacteria bacterium RIFCSPLOWO2_02_FULL_38_15]
MRGKKSEKRILFPDPIYRSRLINRLINKVMKDGKKSTAQAVVYSALEEIKQSVKQDPLSVLEKAVQNVSPRMEVRPRRVGGASYQVPVEVRGDRKEALAIRWILAAARSKSNSQYHSFGKKLATELMDAASNTGASIKKRDDTQKVAAANRAFSHFRW